MNDVTPRIAAIRAALAASAELRVLPPATIDAVTAFEARLGIGLPPAYRRFVLEVCEGIEQYEEPQLYTLAQIEALCASDAIDPKRPFPYGDVDAAALRRALASLPANSSVFDNAAFMALQKRGGTNGALTVAGNGGNDFSVLVVTGEQRGWMWRTGELDHPEPVGLYDSDTDAPLDFIAWFCLWAPSGLGVTVAEQD